VPLLKEGDSNHFMTKRFDRTDSGEKLHIQTLAGIAHYDRDQRHAYEQAFRLMRQMQLPYIQQEEFYRRMVFNVVARNHDDHTKNHSFIMDRSGQCGWLRLMTCAIPSTRKDVGRIGIKCLSTASKTDLHSKT
jgi:serine/threonine protein kinase HipA of HipAB toxin-antitoxin module